MNACRHVAVLVDDPDWAAEDLSSPKLRLVRKPDLRLAKGSANILVVVRASRLQEVASFARRANSHHHLKVMLVRADLEPCWITHLLESAGLRMLKNLHVHADLSLAFRVVGAWRMGAQDQLIADAVVLGDRLMVVDCALRKFEVRLAQIPGLTTTASAGRKRFNIAPDGAYIHWPDADVHVDIGTLQVLTSRQTREQVAEDRLRRDRLLGGAIATVRAARGLRRAEVEGLSSRQVERLESGQSLPRTATLNKLAAAHGMTLAAYLDALALEMRVPPTSDLRPPASGTASMQQRKPK